MKFRDIVVCKIDIFMSNNEYIIRSRQEERALGVRPRVRSITHTRLGQKNKKSFLPFDWTCPSAQQKGRELAEDDDAAADGVILKTIIRQTANGSGGEFWSACLDKSTASS